jgi:sulfate transport system substrate-binding protein
MNRSQTLLNLAAVAAVVAGVALIIGKNATNNSPYLLLNVSYDPTRELYQTLNPLFVASYEKATGQHWEIVQSHGGSSRQARKVISGELKADVVTLGLYSDVDALRKRGLIAADWADRLPDHSLPYSSTIVFVVRHGNPRGIGDWQDLLAPGLEIVTPDPRTSGNGKLTALAAWAAVTNHGGSDEDAQSYLRSLYQHVHSLDEGARGAATSFAIAEIGDVHLTWENEALREVAESNGKLQIVYPQVSILAEPYVAWVDSNVVRDNTRDAAKAYLTFLFSDSAQETIARLGYRPYKAGAAEKAGVSFPAITLVPIKAIARDWDDANEKFFAENGMIDAIIGSRQK